VQVAIPGQYENSIRRNSSSSAGRIRRRTGGHVRAFLRHDVVLVLRRASREWQSHPAEAWCGDRRPPDRSAHDVGKATVVSRRSPKSRFDPDHAGQPHRDRLVLQLVQPALEGNPRPPPPLPPRAIITSRTRSSSHGERDLATIASSARNVEVDRVAGGASSRQPCAQWTWCRRPPR